MQQVIRLRNFNSKMVRLKVSNCFKLLRPPQQFQFQNGTIKSLLMEIGWALI